MNFMHAFQTGLRPRQIGSRLKDQLRSVKWRIGEQSNHYLAVLNRIRLRNVTFVGITGSAGKTTTKELSAAILGTLGQCQMSPASRNRHSGIDETVLATTSKHVFSVVEVSASRPGYLERSVRTLKPRIAVLTLVAREHYSAFRSIEAIAEEKWKLVEALPKNGIAVLNIDDPYIRSRGEHHSGSILWVGRDEAATIRLLECHSNWPEPLTLRVCYQGRNSSIRTRLHGTHLALPVLSALGIAVAAGVSFDNAVVALAELDPTEGRMQVETAEDGVVFIRDDWKAPQWSLQAPFEFMRNARAQRKVIVLGTISDSPKSPTRRYAAAAQQALEVAELVVLVGTDTLGAAKLNRTDDGSRLRVFASVQDAAAFLKTELRRGDLVLLKGTNTQDHLVRIVLDRRQKVQCWQSACRKTRFCASCPRLYDPSSTSLGGLETRPTAEQQLTDKAPLADSSGNRTSIVVGLGNQGARYSGTPHNVGFRAVEAIAAARGSAWEQHLDGWVSDVNLDGTEVTLFKPAAQINHSGPVIARFLQRTGRSPHNCILIHDDADLPLGSCRAKRSGGDGGHKGVRSILATLGTNEIARIRIGVRRPGDVRGADTLVLKNLTSVEEPLLKGGLDQVELQLMALIEATHGKGIDVLESAS